MRVDSSIDLVALFNRSGPVEVDIGCGKGAFLVHEAARKPDVNFVGVDYLTRKLDRTRRELAERGLDNVRLFRCEVFLFVDRYLPESTVSAFHIYFPDPWPKKRQRGKRFITRSFVTSLAIDLVPEGRAWLATDSSDYFAEMLELFSGQRAFRRIDDSTAPGRGMTEFEQEFKENNVTIFRAGFEKAREPLFRIKM